MYFNRVMEVQVCGEKVLLVRSGGALSALGSRCTHYGAPLSAGEPMGKHDTHDPTVSCPRAYQVDVRGCTMKVRPKFHIWTCI